MNGCEGKDARKMDLEEHEEQEEEGEGRKELSRRRWMDGRG